MADVYIEHQAEPDSQYETSERYAMAEFKYAMMPSVKIIVVVMYI